MKGLGFYIPPLTGKPEQQQFAMRSGVLTSRQRSAISGRPLRVWVKGRNFQKLCPAQHLRSPMMSRRDADRQCAVNRSSRQRSATDHTVTAEPGLGGYSDR